MGVRSARAPAVQQPEPQPPLIELLPSVTYGINQSRDTAAAVERGRRQGERRRRAASSASRPNITLDGTINPDFSQVESDAFQVEVNQRFPIFFSEKRPFFMEGMGLFNIAGTGGDGNMRTAVHTRRIIDPFWGTKLTGTAGKTTFGVLNALDESPEDVGNRGDAFADRNKLFTIGRATYALRRSDYVGAIFTDTEHAGRHNLVVGGDLVAASSSAPQQFSATFLASQTERREHGDTHGTAAQVVVQLQHAPVQRRQPGRALRPATSRWTRRSTTAPASRPAGRSAR